MSSFDNDLADLVQMYINIYKKEGFKEVHRELAEILKKDIQCLQRVKDYKSKFVFQDEETREERKKALLDQVDLMKKEVIS